MANEYRPCRNGCGDYLEHRPELLKFRLVKGKTGLPEKVYLTSVGAECGVCRPRMKEVDWATVPARAAGRRRLDDGKPGDEERHSEASSYVRLFLAEFGTEEKAEHEHEGNQAAANGGRSG